MNSDSSLAYAKLYCKDIAPLIKQCRGEIDAFEKLDSEIKIRDSRIRQLEELLLAVEETGGGGLFANCSDWFDKRDKLLL